MLLREYTSLCTFSIVAHAAATHNSRTDLPLVDLGYAIHQPTFNPDNEQYAFRNIRYADPPVDELRFRAPSPVSTIDNAVNDGSVGYECRQGWARENIEKDWLEPGETAEEANERLLNYEGWSEDCLFLNVITPKAVFDKQRNKCRSEKPGAPVIVWIHGGGYMNGWKQEHWTTPDQLVTKSGAVFVAMNYRLGIFGFLAGGDDRIPPNLGLLDQRLALEWVQGNIHLFGGDPDNVTVIGESAGAGSLAFHLTAHGGQSKAPFKRAILQSIGARPVAPYKLFEKVLDLASEATGRTVATGEDLAALNASEIARVNADLAFYSTTGLFTFTPTIDGDYVQDWPTSHLLKGEYDPSPQLMLSHTANETIAFLPEALYGGPNNDDVLVFLLEQLVGSINETARTQIFRDLYPPVSPETSDLYTTHWARALLLTAEAAFDCQANDFARAWGNEVYSWALDIGNGRHGLDVGYVFYNGSSVSVLAEPAIAIQTYIGQFVQEGDPNTAGDQLPQWPQYGDEKMIVEMKEDGPDIRKDKRGITERCQYWQRFAGTGKPVPPPPASSAV